jgi:hypothetical protein
MVGLDTVVNSSDLISRYSLRQSHELDEKILQVHQRILTERKVLQGTQAIGQATTNPEVLRRNAAKVKEAQQSLLYFENTLLELQARKLQLSQREDSVRSHGTAGSSSSLSSLGARLSDKDRALPQVPPASDYGGPGLLAANAGTAPGPQHSNSPDGGPKVKTFNNLDLIRADTPHTPAKISRMLHQLEFKLQVEMQYKKGIDKMVKLYQADGDKKSRADAESKKVESEKKIQLFQTALKKYKNLHILDDADDEEELGVSPGLISRSTS